MSWVLRQSIALVIPWSETGHMSLYHNSPQCLSGEGMLPYGCIASLLFLLSSTALFDSLFCLFVLFVFVLHCWFVFLLFFVLCLLCFFDLYSMLSLAGFAYIRVLGACHTRDQRAYRRPPSGAGSRVRLMRRRARKRESERVLHLSAF